jgi:hypothetical protein
VRPSWVEGLGLLTVRLSPMWRVQWIGTRRVDTVAVQASGMPATAVVRHMPHILHPAIPIRPKRVVGLVAAAVVASGRRHFVLELKTGGRNIQIAHKSKLIRFRTQKPDLQTSSVIPKRNALAERTRSRWRRGVEERSTLTARASQIMKREARSGSAPTSLLSFSITGIAT